MTVFSNERLRSLRVGISSYTENEVVLDVIGNVNISGDGGSNSISLSSDGIATIGDVKITSSGIITSSNPGISTVVYYGDGSNLIGVSAFNVITQDLSSNPVFPTFASTTGVTSVGISSSKFVFIPSSGSVGLGITNPTSRLHVDGDGYFTGVITASTFSGNATSASYASVAGVATYSGNSGIATYATSSGIATYASTAGVSTYSENSGIATYAISSGIATYASTAGVATALQNSRTFEITGDIIASPISFDGTGNVSLAATIQPNSVALGTDTTGDYVQSISGTANQITVTGGTGEGSSPVISIPTNPVLPGNVTIANDLQVNHNLNVTGNITIGGTSAYIISNDFRVKDADIVTGFTTDSNGNDVSNDTTANHGGIAVASTEGSPLVQLYNVSIGETNPATYKKIMWFKSGTFAGLNTDAWLINYAVGIGSTQFPSGTRLAAGSVQFTENDLAVVRNINASGIITASGFVGSGLSLTDVRIGINSGGVSLGTANVINFTGAGISAITVSSGIATINIPSSTRSLNTYTATEGQTSFAASYKVGYVDVFLNGVKLSQTQYIATDETTVNLTNGASLGDIVEIVGYEVNIVGEPTNKIGVATAGGIVSNDVFLLDFRGSGISTVSVASGIATINIIDNTNSVLNWESGVENDIYHLLGNVGIGTDTPLYKIDVLGDINLTGTLRQNGSPLIASRWEGGTGNSIYKIDGNVGIGISTPNYKLHVSGNTYTSGITSTSLLYVGYLGVHLLTANSNGNVGVGLTNPTSKFHVNGNTLLGGNLTVSGNSNVTGNSNVSGDFNVTGNSNIVGVLTASAFFGSAAGMSDLPISTQWKTVASGIHTSSNVGIKSDNPQVDLDVAGSFRSNDLRVNSASEKSTLISGNIINISYNSGGGNIAICTNPTGPITLNVMEIPTDNTFDNRSLTFSVIAIQTSVSYACSAITLNGVSRPVKFPNGVISAGNTNCYDIFNFTAINTVGSASTTANYQVLGLLNGNFK